MNELKVTGAQSFMEKNIPVVLGGFGPDNKCVCDKTIAEIHGMEPKNVRARITDNIERFREKVDYIDLLQRACVTSTSKSKRGYSPQVLELLQSMGYSKQSVAQAEHIYILSERGYGKLVKIMDTDQAWEVYEKLLDEYFELRDSRRAKASTPDDESRKLRARAMALNAANRSARMLMEAYDSAGIQPSYKVLALTDLYRNEGLKLPTPPLEVDEVTYDFTEMAKELGIMSEASGKPHAQAVGAIVSTLAIPEQMIVHAPYDRNGHAADYDRYKAPVLDMVRNWLAEHGNPRPIAAKGKNYRVKYAS